MWSITASFTPTLRRQVSVISSEKCYCALMPSAGGSWARYFDLCPALNSRAAATLPTMSRSLRMGRLMSTLMTSAPALLTAESTAMLTAL